MRSILRRMAAILVLTAAGALLAACGKSAHFDGTKHGGAKTVVSTAAGEPLTKARAKKLALALNLRASDLPGFTVAKERQHATRAEQSREYRLLRCMGGRTSSDALAEASSKSFERQAQVVRVSVSSSVTIVRTPAQAEAELKAIRSDHTRTCLARFMGELLASQTHKGASEKLVSISKATPSAAGTSGTFAWQIVGAVTLQSVRVPFYLELVGFSRGQDEVELLSFGLPVPFPAAAEQELFALLVERAKAGGASKAGKGSRPPKTPSLSGPRRVQISL
jgi:hypothetical protein